MAETFCVYAGPVLQIHTKYQPEIEKFIEGNDDLDVFIPKTNERTFFYVLPERRVISGRQSTVSPTGNQEPILEIDNERIKDESAAFIEHCQELFGWQDYPGGSVSWAVVPYYK